MGILTFLLDGVLHKKRDESDAARAGRRSAIKDDARNPYVAGSKDYLDWIAARTEVRDKLLEAQQW